MPRGGAGRGQGRKPKEMLPAAVSKDQAQKILSFLEQEKNPHPPTCKCLCCRYWEIAESRDLRLRLMVFNSLLNRTLGLPPKAAGAEKEKAAGSAPGKLVVEVEYLGNPDAAQE